VIQAALRYLQEDLRMLPEEITVWDPMAADGTLAGEIRKVIPNTYATDTKSEIPAKPGFAPLSLDFLTQRTKSFEPDVIISSPNNATQFIERGLEYLKREHAWVVGVLAPAHWDSLQDQAAIVESPYYKSRQVVVGTGFAWYWFDRIIYTNPKPVVTMYDEPAVTAPSE
jgi:hypothetical protein